MGRCGPNRCRASTGLSGEHLARVSARRIRMVSTPLDECSGSESRTPHRHTSSALGLPRRGLATAREPPLTWLTRHHLRHVLPEVRCTSHTTTAALACRQLLCLTRSIKGTRSIHSSPSPAARRAGLPAGMDTGLITPLEPAGIRQTLDTLRGLPRPVLEAFTKAFRSGSRCRRRPPPLSIASARSAATTGSRPTWCSTNGWRQDHEHRPRAEKAQNPHCMDFAFDRPEPPMSRGSS
jgi:hypothetical protein